MIDRETYLSDPCGTLSIPYYKAVRMTPPAQLRIVHDRRFDGRVRPDETDTRYFRLRHALTHIDEPAVPRGCTLRVMTQADAAQLSRLLSACWPGDWDQKAAAILQDAFAYAPAQIGLLEGKTLVGCCLGAFDAECREGTIEWLAVHPTYRGRGVGRAAVNACLGALREAATFTTVSGQVENPTNPLALYRRCGFTGEDIWHVISPKT